jgi:hypothetical protein
MKKSVKYRTYTLVINLCLVLVWIPLFMNYYSVMQADFLKSGQTYENINLDILPADQKSSHLLWTIHSYSKHWFEDQLKGFDFFPFSLAFLEQNTIKIRC